MAIAGREAGTDGAKAMDDDVGCRPHCQANGDDSRRRITTGRISSSLDASLEPPAMPLAAGVSDDHAP